MPTVPAAYAGLRLFKGSGDRTYVDVDLAAKGGGGQITTGILAGTYEGKSFGVFG